MTTSRECRDVALLSRIWWEVYEAKGDAPARDACADLFRINDNEAKSSEDEAGWLRWLDRRGRWRR